MRARKLVALGGVLSLLAFPALSQGSDIGIEPGLRLMERMAEAQGMDREYLARALWSYASSLGRYLEEQGVPVEALGRVQERFRYALTAFRGAGADQGQLVDEVALLADELAALAAEGEVNGLPAELLRELGVSASAIEALRDAAEMDGLDVAEIAMGIAGRAEGLPEQAGPPDDVGPQDDTGPPVDVGPPADAGPPDGTPAPDDAGPPADVGPPADAGPPDNVGPPGGGDDEDDEDDGPGARGRR